MLNLQFKTVPGAGLNILCLGAHCDDIEIGCGGSMLKLIQSDLVDSCHWVVFCSNEVRKKEAEECAQLFLQKVPLATVQIFSYKDAFLPSFATEIKNRFESIKASLTPDLIFTHYRSDRHQDHRLISDLTWNTFRQHLILEYEIPKYDGDLGQPNFYIQLDQVLVQRKVTLLNDCYPSQREKHWFDEETFRSIMRIRGLESGGDLKYAEAFHARKMVF